MKRESSRVRTTHCWQFGVAAVDYIVAHQELLLLQLRGADLEVLELLVEGSGVLGNA